VREVPISIATFSLRWQPLDFQNSLFFNSLRTSVSSQYTLSRVNPGDDPTLRKGGVVIMDILGSHKVKGVREAIEAAGASLMFIPPYSPDLNPIEQAFTKLKALLRAKKLRTVDALWKAIRNIANCFTAQECANFLRHAGYFQSA
jgi:transposase